MSETQAGAVPMERLREWIGRSETLHDEVGRFPVAALAATFDRDDAPPQAGDALPPLWHWLYFLPVYKRRDLGADGHAKLGGFLPPVPLPRRMWAGSQLQFHHNLKVGDRIQRVSTISDVTPKTGRTGTLVFVKVLHEISGPQGLAITETHDIVYREAVPPPKPGPDGKIVPAATGAGKPAPADPEFTRPIEPDPVLLFRYSALTFNGHRIHYDQPYVTAVEGYRGLVVHGPMIATLMLENLRDRLAASQPGKRIASFEFRAISPIVDIDRFAVCAAPGDAAGAWKLWARKDDGTLCMEGSATVE